MKKNIMLSVFILAVLLLVLTSCSGNVEHITEQKFVRVNGATVSEAVTGSGVFTGSSNVTIPDLLVSDHEVTQYEYQSVVGNNPSYFQGKNKKPASGEVQKNRPVENVSWYDAIYYCNKRSSSENLTPCYSVNGNTGVNSWIYTPGKGNKITGTITCDFTANGYRLPTVSEWEYIARGGNDGIPATQTTYSGSNTINDVAWHRGNKGEGSHEVKKKAPNSLGIYDMSGNVWEWCWDLMNYAGTFPKMRGGSCYEDASNCKVTSGSYSAAYEKNEAGWFWDLVGFRVVRSVTE